MQEQPKLVGCRPRAGRAIRRQMGLPGLDMVFGLAAPAIDILVEPASVAFAQIGDDEAGVRSFHARFDAGDDPLDPAPALRAVEERHETTKLAVSRRGLESRLRAGFETFDMAAQCRGWRDAEDVIEAIGATPIENLGTAIVAVGPQQDLGVRPVSADRAQQAPQEGLDLLAARPLGGTKHGGDEAAFAVEHDDRLKSVFVVVGVEQPQLLTTVDRIERVVDVQRDPFGNPWRRTRNTDRPSPCPSAARRESPADSPTAILSTASTTPDRWAKDRAPS